MRAAIRAATLATILTAFAAATTAAQSFWLGPVAGDGATLEVVRPSFKELDLTATSLAYYLSMRLHVTPSIRVVGELPFSHVGFEVAADAPSGVGNMMGNPYLGGEWTPTGSMFSVEAGARLPLAEEGKWRVLGMYGDIDRAEAFNDAVTLSARGNLLWPVPDTHWALRVGAGPSLWLESEGDGTDSDVMLGYGGQLWYRARLLDVGTGLTGFVRASGEGSFADRSFHQIGLMANLATGLVQPGLTLRLPVGENMSDVLDYAIGVHVTVSGLR